MGHCPTRPYEFPQRRATIDTEARGQAAASIAHKVGHGSTTFHKAHNVPRGPTWPRKLSRDLTTSQNVLKGVTGPKKVAHRPTTSHTVPQDRKKRHTGGQSNNAPRRHTSGRDHWDHRGIQRLTQNVIFIAISRRAALATIKTVSLRCEA